MTNHVHLLATPMTENGLSSMMQALGRRYVRYINNTYKRTGTLWEGRYKASLIDSNRYLLTCMRYIELNPVRASMVEHPGEYRWSSYHANAQHKEDVLIHHHPIYTQLGGSDDERKACYRELFRNHIDSDTVHQIRDALNQELVLGRSYFKDRIEEMSNRQTRPGNPGRPHVKEESANYYVLS
jgi:putative transposase